MDSIKLKRNVNTLDQVKKQINDFGFHIVSAYKDKDINLPEEDIFISWLRH